MIPVPLFHLTFPCEFAEPAQELQTGGTGNREKTNRCEAVKLEITGNRPVPDSVPISCFSALHASFRLTPRRFRTGHGEAIVDRAGPAIAEAFSMEAGIEGREPTEPAAPSAPKPLP